MKVIKRDGTYEQYNYEKIKNQILNYQNIQGINL